MSTIALFPRYPIHSILVALVASVGVAEMGFSAAVSMGYHIVIESCHRNSLKCMSVNRWKEHYLNFKVSKCSRQPGRISLSRSEFTEFDERTSPNEVKPGVILFQASN